MKILAMDVGKHKTVVCEYDARKGHPQYETVRTTPFSIGRVIAWAMMRDGTAWQASKV